MAQSPGIYISNKTWEPTDNIKFLVLERFFKRLGEKEL